MSRPPLSLLPDEPSAAPQHTPPEDRVLRRAMDAATLDLIRGAATAPVQIAELSAQLAGLRQETRDGLLQLRDSAGRTEAQLQELVGLQRHANELRAAELEEARETRRAREEAARWWRSLVTPQGVLYLGVLVVTLLGALLGVGHLLPPPRVSP